MVVNVYSLPHVMKLTLDDFTSGANMITSAHYTNSEIKILRGTDQRIDLLLKNYDRQAVLLEEWQTVNFHLYDRKGKELLKVAAELYDFPRGHYVINLSKAFTSSLVLGHDYSWCCTVEDSEADTVRMLHSNRDYGSHAPAIIAEGPTPAREETISIALDTLSQSKSQALKGAAQVSNFSGVHSLVFDLTEYTGTITVQASVDDGMPTVDDEWVNVTSEDIEDVTGLHHMGFTGNFMWVRFVLSTETGVGDTITYRNL